MRRWPPFWSARPTSGRRCCSAWSWASSASSERTRPPSEAAAVAGQQGASEAAVTALARLGDGALVATLAGRIDGAVAAGQRALNDRGLVVAPTWRVDGALVASQAGPIEGPPRWPRRRRSGFAVGAFLALDLLAGCSQLDYARQAARASEKLAGVTRLGAATWAPYEVTLAEAYLRKAAEEAAEAEYEQAVDLARDAETLLDRALQQAPRVAP